VVEKFSSVQRRISLNLELNFSFGLGWVWDVLLNPKLDLQFRFSSGSKTFKPLFENLELNFRFGSGRFGFEPKFRTELVHHQGRPSTVLKKILVRLRKCIFKV